jgi:cholesterol transport system auxiliary component
MRESLIIHISSAALLILLLAGCGGLSKSYPERNYYMFEVPPVTNKLAPVKGAMVEVYRFNVSPGSEGKEFIYRTGDVSYESDFYNQFFRPPGAMLTELTIRWLGDAGLFTDVMGSVSQTSPNYYIEANVVQLYGDYRSSPKAVMQIQFILLKFTTDSNYNDNTEIVFGKTYTSEIPIASKTPYDLMIGWNTALGDILNSFLTDMQENVK